MPSNAFGTPHRHQHWNVQEGEAQDLAPGLEKSEAQALVFVSMPVVTMNGRKLSFKPLSERPK